MKWQPIETAPKDGTTILTICGRLEYRWQMLDFKSRWIDGRWCAHFGDDGWKPYEPDPSYWKPYVSTKPENVDMSP